MQVKSESQHLKQFIEPSTLVAASDLSDVEQLLPHVLAQAKGMGSTVILVHVLSFSGASEAVASCNADDSEDEARKILSGFAARLEKEDIRCSALIRRGVAAKAILEAAREAHAARIVIGSHRHGHSGQTIIGTVANAVILESDVPVFIVPQGCSDGAHAVPRQLLHPVSLSVESQKTTRFVVELAKAYGAHLTLIHVVQSSVLRGSYVREIFTSVNQKLNTLIASMGCLGMIRTIVTAGEPVLEILKVGVQIQADWMIMGVEHDFPWWSTRNNAAYQVLVESSLPLLLLRERMLETSHCPESAHYGKEVLAEHASAN